MAKQYPPDWWVGMFPSSPEEADAAGVKLKYWHHQLQEWRDHPCGDDCQECNRAAWAEIPELHWTHDRWDPWDRGRR